VVVLQRRSSGRNSRNRGEQSLNAGNKERDLHWEIHILLLKATMRGIGRGSTRSKSLMLGLRGRGRERILVTRERDGKPGGCTGRPADNGDDQTYPALIFLALYAGPDLG
jgi:hypothetical protein